MDPEELEARKFLGLQVQLGHCLSHILPQADEKLLWPSYIPLFDQLVYGISLNNGAQASKYYLNKQTNSNRVYIPPKSLNIAWGHDPRYWKWELLEEWDKRALLAVLIRVNWFDVRGTVKASLLSSRVLYLVAFVIYFNEDAHGWHVPVNLVLKKPNGCKIESKVSIEGKPKGEYFEVDAGELILDNCGCGDSGIIEFAMYEHGSHEKRGLVMKGVILRSKASDGCPHANVK
ncbi:unnamed protein product [Citrullus colocynthis]|uniref:Uncharacterized protein n=1 Tax=Citrullus colocynthis TaxID=252529 RepID=A0ABP0XXL1_9ROSI